MKKVDGKKTIVYVSSDSNKSGVPVHLIMLIKNLKDEFDIELVCPDGWLAQEAITLGIRVHIIKVNLKSYFKIKKIYSTLPKKTIIHCHGVKAGLVGRLAARNLKNKLIYTEHNWTKDYELKQKTRESVQLLTLKKLAVFTDKIICVSNAVKDFYLEKELSKEKKLGVIYNGVEFFEWSSIDKDHEFNFSTIATLDRRKGIDILIQSIKLLSDDEEINKYKIKFNILGNGTEENSLKRLANKLSVSDKINWLSNEISVEELFSKTDIYIQPSRDESFGMALCEAVGSGIPSIATNAGAIPEILNKKFLFEKNNPQDLYKKIKAMILRYDEYEALFTERRDQVQKKFSIERMISNYRSFYKEL